MQARPTADLLRKLTKITERNLAAAETLLALPTATLHQRPRPESWNALECLAHLNHYGDFYLPEIRRAIAATRYAQPQSTYTSGWLGNKLAAGMKPGPKTRKVKTFKSADPVRFADKADLPVIKEFIRQQRDTLELLRAAAGVDLTRTKIGTSISRFLKLRLADGLRTVVYHNWRHVEQAQRAANVREGVH